MITVLLYLLFICPITLLSSESINPSACSWDHLPNDVKKIISTSLPRLEDLSDANIPLKQKIDIAKYITRLRLTNRAALDITLPEQYTLSSPHKIWVQQASSHWPLILEPSEEFIRNVAVASILSPDFLLTLLQRALHKNNSGEMLDRLLTTSHSLNYYISKNRKFLIDSYHPHVHSIIIDNFIKTTTHIASKSDLLTKIKAKNSQQNLPQAVKIWCKNDPEKNLRIFFDIEEHKKRCCYPPDDERGRIGGYSYVNEDKILVDFYNYLAQYHSGNLVDKFSYVFNHGDSHRFESSSCQLS